MRVGRPACSSSKELEAELMAQSVSRSGGICQSRWDRQRRLQGRPEVGPVSLEDVEGWSGFISGVCLLYTSPSPRDS